MLEFCDFQASNVVQYFPDIGVSPYIVTPSRECERNHPEDCVRFICREQNSGDNSDNDGDDREAEVIGDQEIIGCAELSMRGEVTVLFRNRDFGKIVDLPDDYYCLFKKRKNSLAISCFLTDHEVFPLF